MKLLAILSIFAAGVFGQGLTVTPFNFNSTTLAAFAAFSGNQSPNIQVWLTDSNNPPAPTYQVTVFYRDQAGNSMMDSRSVANQKSPTGITITQFLHDDLALDMVIVQPPTGAPAVWNSTPPALTDPNIRRP